MRHYEAESLGLYRGIRKYGEERLPQLIRDWENSDAWQRSQNFPEPFRKALNGMLNYFKSEKMYNIKQNARLSHDVYAAILKETETVQFPLEAYVDRISEVISGFIMAYIARGGHIPDVVPSPRPIGDLFRALADQLDTLQERVTFFQQDCEPHRRLIVNTDEIDFTILLLEFLTGRPVRTRVVVESSMYTLSFVEFDRSTKTRWGFPKFIEKLLRDIDVQLAPCISAIEEEEQYAPGGIGYEETRRHFKEHQATQPTYLNFRIRSASGEQEGSFQEDSMEHQGFCIAYNLLPINRQQLVQLIDGTVATSCLSFSMSSHSPDALYQIKLVGFEQNVSFETEPLATQFLEGFISLLLWVDEDPAKYILNVDDVNSTSYQVQYHVR